MSKLMYRVYTRDIAGKDNEKKWSLLASFLIMNDAEVYIDQKELENIKNRKMSYYTIEYKIMQGGRNIKVYYV